MMAPVPTCTHCGGSIIRDAHRVLCLLCSRVLEDVVPVYERMVAAIRPAPARNRLEVCRMGHADWRWRSDGKRICWPCTQERARQRHVAKAV